MVDSVLIKEHDAPTAVETLEETRDRIMKSVEKDVNDFGVPKEIADICFNLVLDFYNARKKQDEIR